jgi:hypothetical protein
VTAPILIAEAPPGTPATRVPARTTHDLSVIALVAPPSGRAHAELPLDLLAELGKRDDVAGRNRHVQEATVVAAVWLAAHQTRWVVVTSPHVLSGPHLQLLATITLPTPSTLVLACDHGTAGDVHDRTADYGAAPTPWAGLAGLLPAPQTPAPGRAATPAGTWVDRECTLPTSDWPTFRSDCRRLLNLDTFTTVDTVYTAAYRTARRWLRANEPTEQDTADLVGKVIGTGGTVNDAVVALRACQAAHMEAGWMLRVDLQQAVNAVGQRPSVLTGDDWRSLRAYVSPHRAAAVALHQHGLTVAAMQRLTLDQVDGDGSRAAGTAIDERARVYLRAQTLHRLAEGTPLTGTLFAEEPRRSVNAIRDARDDLGLRLGTGRISASEHLADRWQRRLGLKLWDLR